MNENVMNKLIEENGKEVDKIQHMVVEILNDKLESEQRVIVTLICLHLINGFDDYKIKKEITKSVTKLVKITRFDK